MRVGVVDVGSNTVRLLVARRNPCLEPLHEARAYLRLGDEIDRNGWILRDEASRDRRLRAPLRQGGDRARRPPRRRRDHRPGRLAQNADELVAALAHGAAARVRVLAAEEEALFAFAGALACVEHLPETVAVCDSGGGSTELVGQARLAALVRSLDVGSLTVRRLLPDDPPGIEAVNDARAIVRGRLEGVVSPFPMAAYATGGTARALRRTIGRTLEAERLEEMIGWLAKRSARGGLPQARPRPEPRLVVARRRDRARRGAEPARRPIRGRAHGTARGRRGDGLRRARRRLGLMRNSLRAPRSGRLSVLRSRIRGSGFATCASSIN